MKRLTHIAMAALLVSFSAAACNDDPLLDLDTVPPTADAGEDQTVTDTDASGSEVVLLDGTGSTAGSFPIVSYTWTEGGTELVGVTQNGGRTVSVDLDVGVHNITLTVEDEAGRTDSDDVVVTVVGPQIENPVITITSPVDQTYYATGSDVEFDGSGVDQNSNLLAGDQLVWTSSIDGEIGTGAAFTKNDLSEGVHVITLTGTDADGLVGTAEVEIAIAAAPTVTITSPADASSFVTGEDVSFDGSGVDFESNLLAGDQLVWTSDLDGDIGTGAAFTLNNLSAGNHVITLTGTDGNGLVSDPVSVSIEVLVSFANSIQPYFVDSGCTGCHGAALQAGGIRLDSYTEITTGGNANGDLIVAGDATQGILVPQLEADHQNGADDQAFVDDFLTSWINDGALDN